VQQTATVANSDLVLLLLIDAIERGKVYIGGGLVDVDVVVAGSEDARNRGS
jgi:hypothetical protein